MAGIISEILGTATDNIIKDTGNAINTKAAYCFQIRLSI